jgi:glutamate/tyrosine decarboxylase-like PLP-dependent enzyme
MRSLLSRAHEHAASHLAGCATRPVGATVTRDELLAGLRIPLDGPGEDPADVIDALAAAATRGAVASAGPRYFGFVIGGSQPVALAADWLTAAWDQNAAIYAASPLASVVEEVAADWLLDLLDLPRTARAAFVTGGQMANFTCLAAARHAVLQDAGWDVEADGLGGAPRVNLVTSAESHVTIDVALRYLGFGTRCITRVATDDQGRLHVDELAAVLAGLSGPVIICAQAGNVNTGSFDPLADVARLARRHGAWLHVDGAFGLWARASRRHRALAAGAELADSWATDAHKWLNVPYDCGVAIVRRPDDLRAAMASQAAYLIQAAGSERDAVDWTPEFSRRARGIPVYATLRTLGRGGIADLVDRFCGLAGTMAGLLAAAPGVRVLNDVVLNQVLVRFAADDDITRAVVEGVQREGTCWLSGTNWHGMAAMRISVSNWSTTEDDARRSVAAILRVFRGLAPPG